MWNNKVNLHLTNLGFEADHLIAEGFACDNVSARHFAMCTINVLRRKSN